MSWLKTHTRKPFTIEDDLDFKFGAWFWTRPSLPAISAAKLPLAKSITLSSQADFRARIKPREEPTSDLDAITEDDLAATTPHPARFAQNEWSHEQTIDSPLLFTVEEHYAQYWVPLKALLEEQRALGRDWYTIPDATYRLALDFDATFLQPLRWILYDKALTTTNMRTDLKRKELVYGHHCEGKPLGHKCPDQDEMNKQAKYLVARMRVWPTGAESEPDEQLWLEFQALHCYSKSILDYYHQWWSDTPQERERKIKERAERDYKELCVFLLVALSFGLAFCKIYIDSLRWPRTDPECFTLCHLLVDWSPFPEAPQPSALIATFIGCVVLVALTPLILKRLSPSRLSKTERITGFVLAGLALLLFATGIFAAGGKWMAYIYSAMFACSLDMVLTGYLCYIGTGVFERGWAQTASAMGAVLAFIGTLVCMIAMAGETPRRVLLLVILLVKISAIALLALLFLVYVIVDYKWCEREHELGYEDSALYRFRNLFTSSPSQIEQSSSPC